LLPAGTGRVVAAILSIVGLSLLFCDTGFGLLWTARLDQHLLRLAYHFLGKVGASVVWYQGDLYGPKYRMPVSFTYFGFFPGLLILTTALVWPTSWKKRIVAIVVGLAAVIPLNTLRLASVFTAGTHSEGFGELINGAWFVAYFAIWLYALVLMIRPGMAPEQKPLPA
jgi:exosortase/archaeosortase family protein